MLKRDDDYFQDSTMTFGEHLEELRRCLFKAVLWLVVGTGLGLLVGERVVAMITAPLQSALGTYYLTAAEKEYLAWVAERQAAGLPAPYTIDEVHDLVAIKKLVFEIRFIHPVQVEQELARSKEATKPADSAPSKLDSDKPPTAPSGDSSSAADAESDKTPSPASQSAEVKHASVGQADLIPVFFWHSIGNDARTNPTTLSAQEAFSIWFKASLIVGVVISSPGVFYHIWAFVAAGLYPHEKRYVYMFFPFSLGLFLAGAALAYVFVFEPVLNFLFSFNEALHLDPDPRISEWLGFVLFLPLGFGVSFQLPLVMLFLERIGVFSVKAYIEKWRIAILVIFVLSAILTPADPYSIFLMAVPLTLLYFGGVLLCKWMPRGRGLADRFQS